MDKEKDKVEKLVSAIYLVTNLFPGDEPMKHLLRTKAADFLSFIVTKKDKFEAKSKATELVSFLSVSHRAGLVSGMNFSILEQEFSRLSALFDSSESASDDIVPLTALFNTSFGTSSREKIEEEGPKKLHSPQVKTTLQTKKSDRQEIILEIAKTRPGLHIKDITAVIKNCSEKTVQRELNILIAAGLLKRTGERRWSRYYLA